MIRFATLALCLAASAGARIWPLSTDESRLMAGGQVLLSAETLAVAFTHEGGALLTFTANTASAEHVFDVGKLPNLAAVTSLSRDWSACWMEPFFAADVSGIPAETQFALLRLNNGSYGVMVPLLDDHFRCALEGTDQAVLRLRAESGDRTTVTRSVTGLYLAAGDDPFELIEFAAREVRAHLEPRAATASRTLPDFARYYGWCSWNAFGTAIDQPKFEETMQRFAAGGVQPGFVIVDAGWQQTNADQMLNGFEADAEKFPAGVAELTRALKQDHGVSRVLLWQTFNGFWRGTAPDASPQAGVREMKATVPSRFPAEAKAVSIGAEATVMRSFYPPFFHDQTIGQPDFASFYQAYHGYLRAAGVDGVKIDAMAWIEILGEGRGGRVKAMQELIAATESSSRDLFAGNLVWCSACSNDMILQAPRSAVMRSSHDFFPKIPASHGRHIVNNAYNSLWMGEWIVPDWDMFQSGHSAGAFHAAARAISGGPVYTTDAPGTEDFALLKKLVLSDRTVSLCTGFARPCADSLFTDPGTGGVPLKIFNFNTAGAVVGAFNCGSQDVRGTVRPADAHGLAGDTFAIYRHEARALTHGGRDDALEFALAPLNFELFTIAPVVDGFAAIGLVDKLNSGGTITEVRHINPRSVVVTLRDGGEFVAYAARPPQSVTVNGKAINAHYNEADGRSTVVLPAGAQVSILYHF